MVRSRVLQPKDSLETAGGRHRGLVQKGVGASETSKHLWTLAGKVLRKCRIGREIVLVQKSDPGVEVRLNIVGAHLPHAKSHLLKAVLVIKRVGAHTVGEARLPDGRGRHLRCHGLFFGMEGKGAMMMSEVWLHLNWYPAQRLSRPTRLVLAAE